LQYSLYDSQKWGNKRIASSNPSAGAILARAGMRRARMISKSLVVGALALATALSSPAQAGSWTLKWSGPFGGVYEGSGECSAGICKSSGAYTGPNGGVWKHTGDAHRTGSGQWAGDGAIVSPGGQTWRHSWTWNADNP